MCVSLRLKWIDWLCHCVASNCCTNPPHPCLDGRRSPFQGLSLCLGPRCGCSTILWSYSIAFLSHEPSYMAGFFPAHGLGSTFLFRPRGPVLWFPVRWGRDLRLPFPRCFAPFQSDHVHRGDGRSDWKHHRVRLGSRPLPGRAKARVEPGISNAIRSGSARPSAHVRSRSAMTQTRNLLALLVGTAAFAAAMLGYLSTQFTLLLFLALVVAIRIQK